MFNPSYVSERLDVQQLIPESARLILDVGCSTGSLGAAIKRRKASKVIGIEYSLEMADVASGQLDRVFVGDATQVLGSNELEAYKFDAILFADVLEHLVDPWSALRSATRFLSEGGVVIASIPNIRHIYTLGNLLFKGYWPYNDRGIHDRTHLRFFTKKNILELFEGAGLRVDSARATYRLIERPSSINRFAKWFAVPVMRDLLAFQYLVRASRA